MPAKTKGIAEGYVNFAILSLVKGKVQFWIETLIIGKMIDRRWHCLILDSKN